jgi:uncharacterized metal-binding protein
VKLLDAVGERDVPDAFPLQMAVRVLALAGRLGHEGAVAKLASIASRREVASVCCLGCGATRKLLSCGKCGVAKFCDRECQAQTWLLTHMPSCKQWREEDAEQ